MFTKQMLTSLAIVLFSLIVKNDCQDLECNDVTCRDYNGIKLFATDFQIYKDAVDVCRRNNRIPFVPKSEYEAWVFNDYQKYIQKNFNSDHVVWYPMQYSKKTNMNRLWDGNANGYMPQIDQASTILNRKNKQEFTCYIGLFEADNYFVRPAKCYDQKYKMICGPVERKASSSESGSTNLIVPIFYSSSEQSQWGTHQFGSGGENANWNAEYQPTSGGGGGSVGWNVEHQPASGGMNVNWNVERQPVSGGGRVGWNVQPSFGGINANWNVEHQLAPGGGSIQWISQSQPVSSGKNVEMTIYTESGVPNNEWTLDRQISE